VANADGTFLCRSCIPAHLDLGDTHVEVWEVGSRGWTAPVICHECSVSIEVYVDGKEVTA
jgi:hypothetical protein